MFEDLRKKFLADLITKRSEELEQLWVMYHQGTLKDTTGLYKLRRQVEELRKKLQEL